MKLTKKKAIDVSIELWTWLAETGARDKLDWEGWDKYGEMESDCALCEYSTQHNGEGCGNCPYYQQYGFCDNDDAQYAKWAGSETARARKKYASQFLEQLRTL